MLSRSQLLKLRRTPLDGRNKVRVARTLAGQTQIAAAHGLGITQSYLSSLENGHYSQDGLPLETTRHIARFYGCAVDDLFPVVQPQELAS